jgi:hypothetical protein
MEALMSHFMRAATASIAIVLSSMTMSAQTTSNLTPTPKTVSMAQLNNIDALDGQLVEVTALVRHTDTAQVFTFGGKEGREIHVVIPNPATDAAHVGDTVAITGFVRRFSASDFERDYRWFRRADYPDVRGGDWVIVAVSVRTPEGTQLVPPMTMSPTSPSAR